MSPRFRWWICASPTRWALRFCLFCGLFSGFISGRAGGQTRDCSFTDSGLVALSDLDGDYRGAPGGIHAGGGNVHPAAHLREGLRIAGEEVQPLDGSGNPDLSSGKVVLISVGMSNTTQEFSAFLARTQTDPSRNPSLVIVDGAQGGRDARTWTDPTASTWATVDSRLAQKGVSPLQVQVAWIKQAVARPGGQDPLAHARDLQGYLGEIVRALRVRYPNVRLAYLSSRTRAYRNDLSLNPEPHAYASGFAVKWLIEDQVAGKPGLGPDAAPWLSWGPYLWADGLNLRSDGFVWACDDTTSDGTHPSTSGRRKVADLLLAFFKTDPTATPWFLRPASGAGPVPAANAAPPGGPAPLEVTFVASATGGSGGIAEYVWSFGDSTFSYNASGNPSFYHHKNPRKTFAVAGLYPVRLTVIDGAGNPVHRTIEIRVAPPGEGDFIRGDANQDGSVDLSDAVRILLHLFLSEPISCLDALDADDSGTGEVTDAVVLLEHLFLGASPLPDPYPARGPDPTPDALVCPEARA